MAIGLSSNDMVGDLLVRLRTILGARLGRSEVGAKARGLSSLSARGTGIATDSWSHWAARGDPEQRRLPCGEFGAVGAVINGAEPDNSAMPAATRDPVANSPVVGAMMRPADGFHRHQDNLTQAARIPIHPRCQGHARLLTPRRQDDEGSGSGRVRRAVSRLSILCSWQSILP